MFQFLQEFIGGLSKIILTFFHLSLNFPRDFFFNQVIQIVGCVVTVSSQFKK